MKILIYNPTNRMILEADTTAGQTGSAPGSDTESAVAHGIRSDEEGRIFSLAPQLLECAQEYEQLLEWAVENLNPQVMPTELYSVAEQVDAGEGNFGRIA